MELNKEQIEFIDFLLLLFSADYPKYVSVRNLYYECADGVEYSDNEKGEVYYKLLQAKIIEEHSSIASASFKLDKLGVEIFKVHKSYSNYLNHLDKVEKKKERKERKEEHLLNLNIVTRWFIILPFLGSLVFNAIQYFEKTKLITKTENMNLFIEADLNRFALYQLKASELHYFVEIEEIAEKGIVEAPVYRCFPTVLDKATNTLKIDEDGKVVEISKNDLDSCCIYLPKQ